MDIGWLVGADEDAGNFQDKDSVSTLLFSISHQIDTINATIEIGGSAYDRIKHPELYKKSESA